MKGNRYLLPFTAKMVEEKVLPALAATLGALFAVYAVRKWTRKSGGLPGEFITCLSKLTKKKPVVFLMVGCQNQQNNYKTSKWNFQMEFSNNS